MDKLGAFHEKASVCVYIPRNEDGIRVLNCNLPSCLPGYGNIFPKNTNKIKNKKTTHCSKCACLVMSGESTTYF